jgi:hypothetical protein
VTVGVGGGGTEQDRLAKTPPGWIDVTTVVYVLVVVVVTGVAVITVTLPDVEVVVEYVTTSSTAVFTCVCTIVDVTV